MKSSAQRMLALEDFDDYILSHKGIYVNDFSFAIDEQNTLDSFTFSESFDEKALYAFVANILHTNCIDNDIAGLVVNCFDDVSFDGFSSGTFWCLHLKDRVVNIDIC